MPKRSSNPPADPIKAAKRAVDMITERADPAPKLALHKPAKPKKKNPAAVALGRLGGKKGGTARARNLTPEQLAEIGRKGAAKRWGSKPE